MRKLHLLILLIICVLILCLLSSCGGGGEDEDSSQINESELSIDLSGDLVGTWSGNSTVESAMQAHFETEVTQNDRDVNGPFIMSGNVDCPEGSLAGSVDGYNRLSSGNSCPSTRIPVATPVGPSIISFHPPGGNAGSIVTIVGERYASLEAGNLLKFSETEAAASALSGTSRLVTTVPINAASGPISLETPSGVAISPGNFMTNVTSPVNFVSKEILLSRSQVGVAVNPKVRRIYFAANHQDPLLGGLMMVDATSQEILSVTPVSLSTNVTLQGVAVSPDGRRVYVACDSFGVCVFDAINNSLKTIIPVASGQGVTQNPQGVALSPDGQQLYVANHRDGGAVSVVNTDTYQPVASISLHAGFTPQGIAVNPDGLEAYFIFSVPAGQNGQVIVYDVIGKGIIDTIEVGEGPIGIAVTPDGNTLYVSNELENTVDVIDTFSHARLWTIQVSAGPIGLSISPDGKYVYVACRNSNRINIIPVASRQVARSLSVSSEPLHVTFTPDGKQAYVSHASSSLSEVIGGSFTLSVAKAGSGNGIIRSSPGAIECGTSCRETFDIGTIVTLAATPDSSSTFTGWDGASDCLDGIVTMDTNKECVAVFNSVLQGIDDGSHVYVKCFIATAAYGSYLDPHVQILRDFRDEVLLKNRVGQILVDYYYEYSPPIAAKISEHEGLKAATRIALTPLVFSIKYPIGSLLIVFIVVVFVGRRIVRKRLASL